MKNVLILMAVLMGMTNHAWTEEYFFNGGFEEDSYPSVSIISKEASLVKTTYGRSLYLGKPVGGVEVEALPEVAFPGAANTVLDGFPRCVFGLELAPKTQYELSFDYMPGNISNGGEVAIADGHGESIYQASLPVNNLDWSHYKALFQTGDDGKTTITFAIHSLTDLGGMAVDNISVRLPGNLLPRWGSGNILRGKGKLPGWYWRISGNVAITCDGKGFAVKTTKPENIMVTVMAPTLMPERKYILRLEGKSDKVVQGIVEIKALDGAQHELRNAPSIDLTYDAGQTFSKGFAFSVPSETVFVQLNLSYHLAGETTAFFEVPGIAVVPATSAQTEDDKHQDIHANAPITKNTAIAPEEGALTEYPARLVPGKNGMLLEINGKQVYPHACRYLPGFSEVEKKFLSEPGPIREFSDQGVHIAFVGTDLGWRGNGQYDYTAIDRQLQKALEVPSMYIIPAVDMRWKNDWWPKANPNERYKRIVNDKPASKGGGSTASFFSDKFRDEASEALRHYIRHVEEMGWAHRIIGYQINWGRAAEWIAWEHLSDINPHALKIFREFLREKYHGDEKALQKAWKDDTVDFELAFPAPNMMRHSTNDGYINDPAEGRRIPDYVECYRRRTTDMLLHFTGIVKDSTQGRALAGAYSSPGYYYQEFERIATSDKIDFCVTSSIYFNRAINGVSLSQALSLESFRKHGKLYWHDADARTYLYFWPNERGISENRYESLMSSLRRDFSVAFLKQMGITWFSLDPKNNVFADHAIIDDIGRIRAICDSALQLDADFSNTAEVAIVYDPENIFRNPYRYTTYTNVSYIKMGTSVEFFPIYDLPLLVKAKSQYKLVILFGCGYITPTQREYIKALQCDGRTLLFMYANGIAEADGFSTIAAQKLSEFQYEFLPGADTKINILPAWQKEFAETMPMLGQLDAPIGARRLCVIPCKNDEVIAVSGNDGKPAWVTHKYPTWTAIQFPGYQTYPEVLRKLAKQAGVRIQYPYSDGTFQSCHEFFCVTGGVGGTRKLTLDSEVIYDIFNDKMIMPVNGVFTVDFLPYETKLFFTGSQERTQLFRETIIKKHNL